MFETNWDIWKIKENKAEKKIEKNFKFWGTSKGASKGKRDKLQGGALGFKMTSKTKISLLGKLN